MKIRKEILDQIVAHAVEDLPNECCGLLLGTAEIIEDVGARAEHQAQPDAVPGRAGRSLRRDPPRPRRGARDRRRLPLASERSVRPVGDRSRAADRSVDVPPHRLAGARHAHGARVPADRRELQSAGTRPCAVMKWLLVLLALAGAGPPGVTGSRATAATHPHASSASTAPPSSRATTSSGCSNCARARRCRRRRPIVATALQAGLRPRRLFGSDGHRRAFDDGRLTLTVDEGRIDEIEILGVSREAAERARRRASASSPATSTTSARIGRAVDGFVRESQGALSIGRPLRRAGHATRSRLPHEVMLERRGRQARARRPVPADGGPAAISAPAAAAKICSIPVDALCAGDRVLDDHLRSVPLQSHLRQRLRVVQVRPRRAGVFVRRRAADLPGAAPLPRRGGPRPHRDRRRVADHRDRADAGLGRVQEHLPRLLPAPRRARCSACCAWARTTS